MVQIIPKVQGKEGRLCSGVVFNLNMKTAQLSWRPLLNGFVPKFIMKITQEVEVQLYLTTTQQIKTKQMHHDTCKSFPTQMISCFYHAFMKTKVSFADKKKCITIF